MGLAGAAVLAAARLLDRPQLPEGTTYRFLGARSAGVVRALVPAVLAGALPTQESARADSIDEVVEAFDRALMGLSPAVRGEIGDLLSLLRYAPTRAALAGVWSSWEEADAQAVAGFLRRWRESPFAMQRAGYQALTQLIQAAWYGNARSWERIGYPGPPAIPGASA